MFSHPLKTLPPIVFARTEVLIPFQRLPDQLAAQPDRGFWQSPPAARSASHGVSELLPHFRRLMSGEDRDERDDARWVQFQLMPELLGILKQRLTVAPAKVDIKALPIALTSVTATCFPRGDGILGLEFEWTTGEGSLTVAAMADALPVLRRVRGSHGQRYHPVWSLTRPERPPGGIVGAFFAAVPDGGLHLRDLASALLGAPDGTSLNGSDLAALHTAVVLKAPSPSEEATKAAIFHLGHGAPTSFMPPGRLDKQTRCLEPRGNRHLVLTREGATALSWPPTEATANSEREWARNRYFGVYRLLHLHVHAERLAIAALNDRAATFANKLDDDRLLEQQGDIEKLLVEVTRYTLSLTGEDCGGNGDHVAFFSVLRAVHRIPQQRDELRAEIDELRALLRAVENRREKDADREERNFQKRVSVFGFYAVPLTLTLAVLGANLDCGGQTYNFSALEFALLVAGGAAIGGLIHWGSRFREKRRERSEVANVPDGRAP